VSIKGKFIDVGSFEMYTMQRGKGDVEVRVYHVGKIIYYHLIIIENDKPACRSR
jgi:hypothetical protein